MYSWEFSIVISFKIFPVSTRLYCITLTKKGFIERETIIKGNKNNGSTKQNIFRLQGAYTRIEFQITVNLEHWAM